MRIGPVPLSRNCFRGRISSQKHPPRPTRPIHESGISGHGRAQSERVMIGRRVSPRPRAQSLEDPSTDMVFIARARIDPAAFDALFADYRERVLRYCFYRLGTWDDAED